MFSLISNKECLKIFFIILDIIIIIISVGRLLLDTNLIDLQLPRLMRTYAKIEFINFAIKFTNTYYYYYPTTTPTTNNPLFFMEEMQYNKASLPIKF